MIAYHSADINYFQSVTSPLQCTQAWSVNVLIYLLIISYLRVGMSDGSRLKGNRWFTHLNPNSYKCDCGAAISGTNVLPANPLIIY